MIIGVFKRGIQLTCKIAGFNLRQLLLLFFLTFLVVGVPAPSLGGEDIFGSCGQSYERPCLLADDPDDTEDILSCDDGYEFEESNFIFSGTSFCQPSWRRPLAFESGVINPFNPDDFTFIVAADIEVSDIPRGGGCAPRSAYGVMTNMINTLTIDQVVWPNDTDGQGQFAYRNHGFPIVEPLAVVLAGDLTHRTLSTVVTYSSERIALQDHWDERRVNPDDEEGPSIRFTVYPGLGNHDVLGSADDDGPETCKDPDLPTGVNLSCLIQVEAKNNIMFDFMDTRMENATAVSYDEETNNYSWDFGNVHMIQGNLWAGKYDDLAWLEADLEQNVGDSGRPVILFQHYGWDGFSTQDRWWNAVDRANLQAVLDGYNVIGIFTGHAHAVGFMDATNIDGPGFDVYTSDDGGSDDACNSNTPAGNIEGDGGFLVVRVINDGRGKGRMEVLAFEWDESMTSAADMNHIAVGSDPRGPDNGNPSRSKNIYTGFGPGAVDPGELAMFRLIFPPILIPPFFSVELQPVAADAIVEGETIFFRLNDIHRLPNDIKPLHSLLWNVSPGFVSDFQTLGTQFETDLAVNPLPAQIAHRLIWRRSVDCRACRVWRANRDRDASIARFRLQERTTDAA